MREGTPLEIFTDREGEIILKKYSPMVELAAFAGQYAEAMSQATGLIVCITDRDQVIAVSGGARKELLQKAISPSLEQVIGERQVVQSGKDEKSFVQLVDEELEGITAQVVAPIICEGDAIGAVAIMSREPRARFGETEQQLSALLNELPERSRQVMIMSHIENRKSADIARKLGISVRTVETILYQAMKKLRGKIKK